MPQTPMDIPEGVAVEEVGTTPQEWQALKDKLDRELRGEPAPEQQQMPTDRPAVQDRGITTPTQTPGTVLSSDSAVPDEPMISGPLAETGPGRFMNRSQEITRQIPLIPDIIKGGIERAQTPQNMRGILRGVGGTAGMFTGFASPMPGGAMIGTGLGSMAGNYLADVYDSYYNANVAPVDKPALVQSTLSHLKDAALDSAVTGGTQVVYPVIVGAAKGLLSKLLKLPPNSEELLKEAASIGVDIGAANMPGSRAAGMLNVLGRMPIIGGSAKDAAKLQAKQLMAAQNDMFGQVATPTAMSEVNDAAYTTAMSRFNNFATDIQRRAEYALKLGEEAGGIIDATKMKSIADTALTKLEALPGGAKAWIGNKEINFLKGMADLPDKVTLMDAKAIDAFAENAIRKTLNATNLATPDLAALRRSAIEAINASDHPAAKLMSAVDADFRTGLRTFGTETARTVGKLDRNIYALDELKPGTKSPDEIVDTIASLKTPQQIQEMRRVVGDDPIKQVLRAKLDIAWNKAQTSAVGEKFSWSAEKFNKSLGIDDPTTKAFEATKEMLRGTGISPDDLLKLSRVAESVSSAPLADVSTFMARAAMLKGAGGIMKAFEGALTLGIIKQGANTMGMGIPGTVATMLMARAGVGSLLRPGLVQAATMAMDQNASNAMKVAALQHLFTSLPNDVLESVLDDYVTPMIQQGMDNARRQ